MAVTYQSSATNTSAGSSVVVSRPSGTTDGDLLLLVAVNSNSDTFTTPSGWTLLQQGSATSGATPTNRSVMWWKVASSEPTSYTITRSSAALWMSAAVLRYSGQDAASPIRVSAVSTSGSTASSTSPTPGTLSGVQASDLSIICYCWGSDTGTAEANFGSTPAGWTSRVNLDHAAPAGADQWGTGILVIEKQGGTDRPTVTATGSGAGGNGGWVVPSLAIITGNQAPTANAGADQSVIEGRTVNLDGSSSSDSEDGAVSAYSWTVTNAGGTGLTTGSLTGANTATPSFSAPSVASPANITLQLQVTDSGSLTDTDTVTVTVNPINVLADVTGAGGPIVGGAALVSTAQVLIEAIGSGGVAVGGSAVVDPSLINILVEVTGSGGLLTGGAGELEVIVIEVQAPTVPVPVPTFEVTLVARTPAETGAPTLAEVDRLVVDGLSYTDELNRPGTASLGCPVRSLSDAVKTRLSDLATHPCEVWIYYGEDLMWAGEVQTLQIQGQTLNVNCAGLLGYTHRMGVTSDLVYADTDQFTIAKGLVDHWQDQSYGDYGIDTSGITTSGVTRDRTYLRDELHNIGQRLEELGAVDDGFDMRIDPTTRDLVLSYPTRGSDLSGSVVFDERNIDSASVVMSAAPEDLASDGSFTGTFQGSSGASTKTYAARENTHLRATYGRSWVSANFSNVTVDETVQGHGDAFLEARDGVMFQPGVTIVPRLGADVGDFGPGDTVSYSYDAGLGRQSGEYRVAKVTVTADAGGNTRIGVEFT